MQPWKVQALTYFWGIWRRRWHCLAVAWILCLAGWTGLAFVPDRYQADAKVYIDTDSLMGPLMQGLTVAPDTDQQVSVMLRTLTTRPNLEKVINVTRPHAAAMSSAEREDAIASLDRDITIRPLGSKNLFSIAYVNGNAAYAEAVTQALVSTLMDSSLGDKRRDMEGAQSFIDSKIAEYEGMLREAEKRAAQFKQENMEFLGKDSSETRIQTARTALIQAKQDYDLAVTRRDSIRNQVAATPASVDADNPVSIVINSGPGGSGSRAGTLAQRLQQERQTLVELQSRYTDNYPDVISTRKTIEQLESELAKAPTQTAENRPQVPNTVFEQLRMRLADEETNVALAKHRLADTTAEVARATETAGKSAEVQAKAADLDRDYDILRKNYQELLERRESARLTKSEDDRQQNIAFRIVEPPQAGHQPVAPNRLVLNSAIFLGGIAGGIAFGFFLAFSAGTFSISDQLRDEFDLPIIGTVTAVYRPQDNRRSTFAVIGATASLCLLVLCYMTVLVGIRTSLHPGGGPLT